MYQNISTRWPLTALLTFIFETFLFLDGNLTRTWNAHIIKAAKFPGFIYCIGEISKVTAKKFLWKFPRLLVVRFHLCRRPWKHLRKSTHCDDCFGTLVLRHVSDIVVVYITIDKNRFKRSIVKKMKKMKKMNMKPQKMSLI